MKRIVAIAVLACMTVLNVSLADDVKPSDVSGAMKKAVTYLRSISTNGGYVGIYSLDLKERFGEAVYEKAGDNEIWVQPPGTPTIGLAYLRAFKVTGDTFYKDAAIDVARALCWGQRVEGGWDHRVDVAHLRPDSLIPERKSGRCTFDDEITQGAIEFLMEIDKVIDADWLTGSIDLSMKFMMESQFDNGAWPQWYPLIGGYHDYYTFNDNTINDCIALMMKVHKTYGRKEYMDSIRLGGDFIIKSQMPKPQSGWAQQYSHDMKPAWARAFEPPAVCSAVTARNIRTLVDLFLFTEDDKYLAPIPDALEWLDNSKIGDMLWARMYEIGTNRPIYGDRDSKVHYDLNEISEERRRGYAWTGDYGVARSTAHYRANKSGAASKTVTENLTPALKRQRAAAAGKLATEALASLDDTGRWVDGEDNMIHVRDFVTNFNRLCQYLETVDK